MTISRKPSRRVQRARACKEPYMVLEGGREVCGPHKAGREEYLCRTLEMMDRQQDRCALCGEFMYADVTFEHEAGKGLGNSRQDDRTTYPSGRWRNAAVHGRCNLEKGSKRFAWIGGSYLPVLKTAEEYMEAGQ